MAPATTLRVCQCLFSYKGCL